jgi:hypothetical protein
VRASRQAGSLLVGLTCPVGRFSVRNLSECQKNQENLSDIFQKRSDTLKSIESKIKTGYFMTKQVIKLPVF